MKKSFIFMISVFIVIFMLPVGLFSLHREVGGFTTFGLGFTKERAVFFLGATEVAFLWQQEDSWTFEGVAVFDPTANVGFEPTVFFTELVKDSTLIFGYFDAPFGLEPTYWDAPDNPLNTLSILQDFVIEEYGEVGARFSMEKELFDLDVYVGNGFGTDLFADNDKTKSVGSFLNFKPINFLNVGGSFSGNLLKKSEQESLMLAGGHVGVLTEQFDMIGEYAIKLINSKIDHHGFYCLANLKILNPFNFALRAGMVKNENDMVANSGSVGMGYEISEYVKVKTDFQYLDIKYVGIDRVGTLAAVLSY